MALISEIKAMETVAPKDKDWFYYGIIDDNYKEIFKNGIRCHALNKERTDNRDSKYYLSLYKDRMIGNVADWYYFLLLNFPMFILNSDIRAIKCSENSQYEVFENSLVPLRYSNNSDEYQAFLKIKPQKIIGIECALLNWSHNLSSEFEKKLENVKKIIIAMNELGIDLPVFDNSRASINKTYEIDKEGIMYLSRKLK